MTKKTSYRSTMVADAQKAATAMKASPIAKQLKSNGFTTATMTQAASDLADLHATAEAARSAWLTASAALQAKAQQFETTWSSYCNIVRGVTSDATVRKAHGVPSPGLRKGPAYKRAPRSTETATTPVAAATPVKPQ